MAVLDTVVSALRGLGGEANYHAIYREVGRLRGITLSRGQEAGVRKEIERHSSDSEIWQKAMPKLPDLFRRISSGRWALRR
jgi:hypothetical protein